MWNQEAATSILTCAKITSSSDVCFYTLKLFTGWPRAQAATFPTSPSRTCSGRPAWHSPVSQAWLRVSWGEEPCPGHFTRWRSPCPGSGQSQNLPPRAPCSLSSLGTQETSTASCFLCGIEVPQRKTPTHAPRRDLPAGCTLARWQQTRRSGPCGGSTRGVGVHQAEAESHTQSLH